MADIIRLIQTRFGTQLQVQRFKAELHARRRAPGESLQQRYQDIRRLVTLAYPSAGVSRHPLIGRHYYVTPSMNRNPAWRCNSSFSSIHCITSFAQHFTKKRGRANGNTGFLYAVIPWYRTYIAHTYNNEAIKGVN